MSLDNLGHSKISATQNLGITDKISERQQTNIENRRQDSDSLICFSHLRWHFVYQRPQHLMARFARTLPVFFVEEPVATDAALPSLDVHTVDGGVTVIVPRLPASVGGAAAEALQRDVLARYFGEQGVTRPVLWYYTPMSLAVSDHLPASTVVYDCMDELSAFKGAPPELVERERALLERADVVFTGGYSLFEAKRALHRNIHAIPSSVDVAHFAAARGRLAEPPDQAALPRPRLGFHGVLDERFDIDLIDAIARRRPDWQLVMIGPVVKIDPATLPGHPNIHYLGARDYRDLPAYLAGWDVALLPFALNESTRFISPTKTPEYLAAGKRVVSTPITDVVRTYGEPGLVRIAGTPDAFITAIDASLRDNSRNSGNSHNRQPDPWLDEVDRTLAAMSWDSTWAKMKGLVECRA